MGIGPKWAQLGWDERTFRTKDFIEIRRAKFRSESLIWATEQRKILTKEHKST